MPPTHMTFDLFDVMYVEIVLDIDHGQMLKTRSWSIKDVMSGYGINCTDVQAV